MITCFVSFLFFSFLSPNQVNAKMNLDGLNNGRHYSLFLEQLVKHLETVLLLKLVLLCGIACLLI
jgi:hypothetical protein